MRRPKSYGLLDVVIAPSLLLPYLVLVTATLACVSMIFDALGLNERVAQAIIFTFFCVSPFIIFITALVLRSRFALYGCIVAFLSVFPIPVMALTSLGLMPFDVSLSRSIFSIEISLIALAFLVSIESLMRLFGRHHSE